MISYLYDKFGYEALLKIIWTLKIFIKNIIGPLSVLLTLVGLLLGTRGFAASQEKSGTDKKQSSAKETIFLELNAQKQVGTACLISFLMKNGLTKNIDELVFELVVFDENQQVSSFLLIKTGELPAQKSRVKRYKLQGVSCQKLSRLLINDIKHCKGDDLSPKFCLQKLTLNSRTTAPLGL